MRRKSVWAIGLCVGWLVASVHAGAATINVDWLLASNDANPEQGYGGGCGSVAYAYMFPGDAAGYARASNNNEWMFAVLTQWDLPDVGGDSIASVNSATAMFVTSTGTYDGTYYFYRLTSAFNEQTLTWDNKPAIDTSVSVVWQPTSNPGNGTWVGFDVSSLLANNGDLQTFGIACIQVGGTAGGFFAMKEAGPAPVLVANYEVVPEPATLLLLAAGGMLLRKRNVKM
jgi:hypothetical protein